MCTQSTSILRPTTPEGSIPGVDFSTLSATSSPVITAANTALASTSAATTAQWPGKLSSKISLPEDKLTRKIQAMEFLVGAMLAVQNNTSLEPFQNREFDVEEITPVTQSHLHIVVNNFSVGGILILMNYDPKIRFKSITDLIFYNLCADSDKKDHIRLIQYAPFVLKLCQKTRISPSFLHMKFLACGSLPCNTNFYPILSAIQECSGFTGDALFSAFELKWNLTPDLWSLKLESIMMHPFLNLFGIKKEVVKERLTKVKAQLKQK